MSTKKIFQDIIDFEILKSLINYLLTSNKNKTNTNTNNNNNNNSNNQYKIYKFYLNINEILNYILVSKKWYNFISLTISNNIINNKLFEHWLKINYINYNKTFIENYNKNQNQYDQNNLNFNIKYYNTNKISFNKEFSIIKIKESIINNYFKSNLFLDQIEIDDFKEIKNKFENNQLLYNRIVVNFDTSIEGDQDEILFKIHKHLSNEDSEFISNLFKILELNHEILVTQGLDPEEEEDDDDDLNDHNYLNDEGNTELYFNNLSIYCYDRYVGEDRKTLRIFKNFKGKNIVYEGPNVINDIPTQVNYLALFDPNTSGQQVESIKVQNVNEDGVNFVEARHLIKFNQFENLHSIKIPINSFLILSNLSKELGFNGFRFMRTDIGNSDKMKSELDQMINSFITSKSLKNLKIKSISLKVYLIDYDTYYDGGDLQTFINNINESKESFSNSFQPLFSELNTSIERIELDCHGLLNINTFSNLLNNKSIKYLYLYNSDYIFYSFKPTGGCDDSGGDGSEASQEGTIPINQYLFDNIFTSPLTSIRHYKIKFKESKEFKLIFNLILNNIFKLELYSLIFKLNDKKLVNEFVDEFKNLINNISTQQQQQEQQQQSNNINLKEIKIKIKGNNKYLLLF
ncbi:hypothetical protein ACTFIW_011111 [Dictyostelium discoideum]